MRRTLALAAALVLIGCEPSAPTSPTPGLAPPTFAVSGRVADTLVRRLAGARVEVIAGPLAGTAVTTDDNGEFTFSTPLAISTEIRASKPGYRDATRSVFWAPGNSTRLEFLLGSSAPTVDLTGEYEITFTADPACGQLPDIARKRTYSATVSGLISLSGAGFGGSDGTGPWNSIYVQQFGDEARFSMYYPPIWEVISNAPSPNPDRDYSSVVISGEALGTVSREYSQIPLSAAFSYCPSAILGDEPKCAVDVVTCQSARHQMTLTRR